MKNVKILSEDPSYAGYEIPPQEIPATEEREAITQRNKSVRVFRKDQIDPLIEKKEFNVLPHPRMKKVKGRVFLVEGVDENGKIVQVQRHESKLDAEVIDAYDNPDDFDEEDTDVNAVFNSVLQQEQKATSEARQNAEVQKKAATEAQQKLEEAQKEIEKLKKQLASKKTPESTTAKPEDIKPQDPLLADPNPANSEPQPQ